ncbi:hypothetical protein ABZZ74_16060 [Streptomyces sp. NPDC006476]
MTDTDTASPHVMAAGTGSVHRSPVYAGVLPVETDPETFTAQADVRS